MYKIAIVIQNVIQWYSLRPLTTFLKKQPNLKTDILVYDPVQNPQDFHDIATSTRHAIEKDGFQVCNTPSKTGYKVSLAPYSDMINFPSQYKLGYCYGAATTKPSLTLQPEFKSGFHGLFLHDLYGAELFSIYGKTYLVPDLYLEDIKPKTKPSEKPVLLYLPTYNEPNIKDTILALQKLKPYFYIIAKSHHGTDYLTDEKSKKDLLIEIADESYSSEQYIKPLFEKADVVLSDNSGAVMDALYAKIPVAITTANVNTKLSEINTLQSELISRGIIPYAKTPSEKNLHKILLDALSKEYRGKQSLASDALFPVKKGGAKVWYDIIKKYLDDDVSKNYCYIHDYLIEQKNLLKQENLSLLAQNNSLQSELQTIKQKLALYETSRAHQALKKVLDRRHKKHQQ